MLDFNSAMFQPCKEWVAKRLTAGASWEEIYSLGVQEDQRESALRTLIDECMWPEDLTISAWNEFLDDYKENHITVTVATGEPVVGIDNGYIRNTFAAPSGVYSAWDQYKESLYTAMSPTSVANIQKSCIWILNHLSLDTRRTGPIKGLVTGSVQSGKTANMEGLISIAADHDWNFFIILSGSIDNLRKQTRDRFKSDLRNSEAIFWQVLDFTSEHRRFGAENLKLNPLSASGSSGNFSHRYVTVCLKQKSRLEDLIDWLYEDPNRTGKLRVVVIDDEADQASINTAEITPEEEQERKTINQLICNLANGKKSDGAVPQIPLQAMNYISYTATPYANVLNEASKESLYPKDFVCTLPEAYEYFGPKVIFGNSEQECPGFPILRNISALDIRHLKGLQKGVSIGLPSTAKAAIAWFLCSTAVLRVRGHKKSVSMLFHTSASQKDHFALYETIRNWLLQKEEVLTFCSNVYAAEATALSKEDLLEANPDYSLIDCVDETMPAYSDILPELNTLLQNITNIMLGEDKQQEYSSGIHLCVDNCAANRSAEEGTFLRIVYPNSEQLKALKTALAFIVIGGNTLSRGLTIDGLVCTYFARTSGQADTLMQMARWFGYRKGYELLQRIWMSDDARKKFEALARIDADLKREIETFMKQGISPSTLGPRIRNIPEIAKFRITAKNKSQRAEYVDFDFCGDSYETTNFDNNDSLKENLALTNHFVSVLNRLCHARKSTVSKAFVWPGIDCSAIYEEYLSKFKISVHSPLSTNLGYFFAWMQQMNDDGKFLKWNVAIVDGDNRDTLWDLGTGMLAGAIERTRKLAATEADPQHVDIGSLRSGRDALCDVDESALTTEQATALENIKRTGKEIISGRSTLGLQDTPLLLIYRIKKDGGNPRTANRLRLDAVEDIIGISIIVSGDSIGESHAKSLRISLPQEED